MVSDEPLGHPSLLRSKARGACTSNREAVMAIIVETATSAGTFTTLVTAVQAAGLEET